jgi:predicted SnoaL-like aldol condensation-catalyzing enzyme
MQPITEMSIPVNSGAVPVSREIVARYFEMWNTGDSSIAAEILSPGWVDHAHPEVAGPHAVQLAVERIRAAQPGLRFRIDAILGDGDLVAVAGSASRGSHASSPTSDLIWLIRLEDGRMAEMWTYRNTASS